MKYLFYCVDLMITLLKEINDALNLDQTILHPGSCFTAPLFSDKTSFTQSSTMNASESLSNSSSSGNGELKQPRRRCRGRREVKNEYISVYQRNSQLSRSVRCANGSKNVLELNVQWRRVIPNGNTKDQPSSSTFRTGRKTWSFHVVVLQRTAKKCTKIYNTRA